MIKQCFIILLIILCLFFITDDFNSQYNYLELNETYIICSYNHYNCNDFNTQAEAIKVYTVCGATDDIHRLDKNHNGYPCEKLK